MKTFKQFCADNFTNGEKTNTGNLAKERARIALDAATRLVRKRKVGDNLFCRQLMGFAPITQIKAARILRKGGYLTNLLTWKQAGRGF
jgi:hypothetical protein